MLIAYHELILPNFWKEKVIMWTFRGNFRGICVLKSFHHKAHYVLRIPNTFMILHLSDVLLQRSTDMLYLIDCLFIINKVQCEEKKVCTTSIIIQLGFTPRDRIMREEFQRTGIFLLCLFLFSSASCSGFRGCGRVFAQEMAPWREPGWLVC